jgi:hypothetical protein
MIDGVNPFNSPASVVRRSEIAYRVVKLCIRITLADLLQARDVAARPDKTSEVEVTMSEQSFDDSSA